MPPSLTVAEVRLQRGRVHRDQRVDVSPGVKMSVLEKWTWKPQTPASVPAGADLGREVGQRADVVADQGRGVGELRAGQLHAVAGVARGIER